MKNQIPPMSIVTEKESGEFRCFIWAGGYETRHIPKDAGFNWEPKAKRWETTDVAIAAKLTEYVKPGGMVEAKIDAFLAEKQEKIEASRATDADIELPAPEGMEYLPFQKAGIAYALDRPSTLIADQMGLGKTIQALGVINATPDAKKILVICPASLRLNWKQEAEKWLVNGYSIKVVDSKKANQPDTDDDIVIINYDVLRKHAEFLRSRTWDLMIVDEAHYLKNPKAQRTKAVLGDKKDDLSPIQASRKLFLTGTPIVNRPIEIQAVLGAIDPDAYGNFFQFAKRYAGAYRSKWGWDFSGATNLDELQDGLRSRCMVRRLKADVLTELPAKRRSVIEIPANGKSKLVNAEQKAAAQHEGRLAELKAAVELAKTSDDPAVYESAVASLRSEQQVIFAEISELRKATAIAKAPLVSAHVSEIVEETGNKVVLFAHHHEVIDLLCEDLAECGIVKLDGRDSMESRNAAVESFQSDDSVKVFVGGIHAAGVGLTLTASAHVVFAELDWVPGVMSQCEDRCHRIGQAGQVLIQHLVMEGSIDANMAKAIVEKQAVIDAALDAPTVDAEADEPVVATSDAVQPVNARRADLEKAAEKLTADEILEIHQNLKTLAARCDGANAIDGQGFNKIDAAIGKSLASTGTLSAKQAALGRRITRKYAKQLSA